MRAVVPVEAAVAPQSAGEPSAMSTVGSSVWATACQVPRSTSATGRWLYCRSGAVEEATGTSTPPRSAEVASPVMPLRSAGSSTASAGTVAPSTVVPAGRPKTATDPVERVPPSLAVILVWLMPSGVTASTPVVPAQVVAASCPTEDPVKEKEPSSPVVPMNRSGWRASRAEVFCFPRPAVSPVSMTMSRVTSPTTDPMRMNRPVAARMSRNARYTAFSFLLLSPMLRPGTLRHIAPAGGLFLNRSVDPPAPSPALRWRS